MESLEYLKDNREMIIDMIKETIFNQCSFHVELKDAMKQVAVYAALPCYDIEDREDLLQIIKDAVQECEQKSIRISHEENVKVQNFQTEREEEMLKTYSRKFY